MKRLVAMAILALAASSGGALAQVYGTNDNPYEVNPFASNMVIEPAPAPPASTAPPAAPSPAPQDSAKTQQTAVSSAGQDAKKPSSP